MSLRNGALFYIVKTVLFRELSESERSGEEPRTRRVIFASVWLENSGFGPSYLDQIRPCRYPSSRLGAKATNGGSTMQGIKGLVVLSAAVVAVVLGACRREEAAPMKLGAEVPAAAQVAH